MVDAAPIYSLSGKRVWVAGHGGMVGSASHAPKGRRGVDLEWRPQAIFLAAARVGGVVANAVSPVDFLYDNLAIALNVIHAAAACGVEKPLTGIRSGRSRFRRLQRWQRPTTVVRGRNCKCSCSCSCSCSWDRLRGAES